ncbi:MAG: hypothetical protein V1839_00215, partial [archaeon]
SMMAMFDIARHEMAQASGLMNVIRQVGGSFGVAILQTLLMQRIAFHTAITGAGIDRFSPVFRQVQHTVQMHAIHSAGSTLQNAAIQSGAVISSHIAKQIFVLAINDDFLFSCVCTAACVIPILFLKNVKIGRKQHG